MTAGDLTANRLTIEEAIARAQNHLDRLIADHRAVVDSIGTHCVRVFDLVGARRK